MPRPQNYIDLLVMIKPITKKVRLSVGFLSLFIAAQGLFALPATLQSTDLLKGTPVSISTADKKTKVFVFLSSQCPCSESHESLLRELAQEFPDYVFTGIHSNANEKVTAAQAHFSQAKLPFTVLSDPQAQLANVFGAVKTPHVFVVDGAGKVVFSGGVTDASDIKKARKFYLKNALTSLNAGQSPQPSEVKTLGCRIERP